MSPGYDLCPSVSSVVPGFTLARTDASIETSADMPFEWVAMRCAAQNHTVSGNLDRCITAPAVIDV